MCVAVPGRVVGIGRKDADVLIGGRNRKASTVLVPEVEVGDWVLVSGGMIVDRLEEEEARERLAIFDELAEVLHENV